jgi:hypothetical protein
MGIKLILVYYSFLKTVLSCYIFYKQKDKFANAVITCDSMNATVVFIDNSAEDDFIRNNYFNNAAGSTVFWLAIYDFIGNETNVNYYTNITLNFTNWYSGQPKNNNKY